MRDPHAPTYIARRDHPTLGPLVKIGRSSDPKRRCANLGARLITTLPASSEAFLVQALAQHRAWRIGADGYYHDRPIFSGRGEWFLFNKDTLELIEAHIATVRP